MSKVNRYLFIYASIMMHRRKRTNRNKGIMLARFGIERVIKVNIWISVKKKKNSLKKHTDA